MQTLQARMSNVVTVIPDALRALHALHASAKQTGVPERTLALVELRASQINGCGVCVDMHARDHRRQPPPHVLDATRVGAGEAQPRLLHGVLGVAQRAEHPVRHPSQALAVLLEPLRQPVALVDSHILSSRSVTRVTDRRPKM